MARTDRKHKKLTWVDISNPTKEDAASLIHDFGINPAIAEELLLATRKSRIDAYDDHMYVILHFPTLKNGENVAEEVDFIIGKDFLVTARYSDVRAFSLFAHLFETETLPPSLSGGAHAGFLFYFLIKELYRSVEQSLEEIEVRLEKIETNIFNGREREMVHKLSLYGRDLADFDKTVGYHRDVLHSLALVGPRFFGEPFSFYLSRLESEFVRLNHQLQSDRAYFAELRETNNSLLSTKQNEVMKTLTIMAFVTFPLTLVAAIFGMNTIKTPLIGHPYDFWIIIGIMGVLSCIMFVYFKHKEWL